MAKENFIDSVVSILQNRAHDKIFLKKVGDFYRKHQNKKVTEEFLLWGFQEYYNVELLASMHFKEYFKFHLNNS